ncbi:uncharacterized protein [Henckelia pumila]|uniref:uncharacterized protein n=1 Tax=Henckelia pumila TaxID=405737 RepID=UPI003C6E4DDF
MSAFMAARKKQKLASSSVGYDKFRFLSAEASDNYMEFLCKDLVEERGIDLSSAKDAPLLSAVKARGWGELIRPPAHAIGPLVREFYANLKERHENFRVLVRGKMVPFDSRTINDVYHVPDIENDEYTEFLSKNLDYVEVIGMLVRALATEVVNNPRLDFMHFYREWCNFVTAALMPSSHVSVLTKERAALVFALITGKSINVGRVIQDSILNSVQSATVRELPHPSLITSLCERAGVSWVKDEAILEPQNTILGVQRPVVSEGQDMPLKGPSPSRSASAPPIHTPLPAHLNLHERVTLIEQSMRNQRRQFDAFCQRVDNYMAYFMEFNSSLVQMFVVCGLNIGPNAVQFPQTPTLPSYPPDDEENDDH